MRNFYIITRTLQATFYALRIGRMIGAHRAARWAGDRITRNRLAPFWLIAAGAFAVPWGWQTWSSTAAAGPGPEDGFTAEVVSIYDGDTMRVRHEGEEIRVRLYCIDAPEMEQEPWGRKSRDYLREITGPEVRVVEHDTDHYGRMIAEVFSRDENLNLAMVQAGWAAEYDSYCDDRAYGQAERAADAARRGVHSEPGLQQTPWQYRLGK